MRSIYSLAGRGLGTKMRGRLWNRGKRHGFKIHEAKDASKRVPRIGHVLAMDVRRYDVSLKGTGT